MMCVLTGYFAVCFAKRVEFKGTYDIADTLGSALILASVFIDIVLYIFGLVILCLSVSFLVNH